MFRKLLAPLLAGSIALTGLTTPARANGNDALVKFIAGATALVIIGKVIEQNRARADTVTRQRQDQALPPAQVQRWPQHDRRADRHRPHRDDRGRHAERRPHQRPAPITMPADCRRDMQTPNGTLRGYGYRCLQRYPRLARNLPGDCLTQVRTRGGTRFLYSARCLARNGYRV